MPPCDVCGRPVAATPTNIRRYNRSGLRLCSQRCHEDEFSHPEMNNVDRALDKRRNPFLYDLYDLVHESIGGPRAQRSDVTPEWDELEDDYSEASFA